MSSRQKLTLLLITGFILRIALAPFWGYRQDLILFQLWGQSLVVQGAKSFYLFNHSDYLPGYLYILTLLGKVDLFASLHQVYLNSYLLYKLPAILADLSTAVIIYLLSSKFLYSPKKSLFAAAVYIFNPAILINSTIWGQVDSLIALCLITSLYFLADKKYWLSAFFLGVGQVIKPIALLALPFYLLVLIYQKRYWQSLIYLGIFGLVILAAFEPFSPHQNLITFTLNQYLFTASDQSFTTYNSFNLWSAISIWVAKDYNFIPDSLNLILSAKTWGVSLFFLLPTLTCLYLLKVKFRQNQILTIIKMLFIVYMSMFLFLTRMHERHAFYALSYLAILLPSFKFSQLALACGLYFLYFFNLVFSYTQAFDNPVRLNSFVMVFLSLTNIILFLLLTKTLLKRD